MKDKLKKIWGDRRNQQKYAAWLWRYSKPYIWKIALTMLLNLSVTLLTLGMTLITKQIIDDAIASRGSESLLFNVGIYFGMVLLVQVLSIFMMLFSTMLNEKFSFGIRKQIYDKILHSHWTDVKRYHTGDLMTRLTSDASSIAEGIVITIPGIIQLVIEVLLVFFTLLYFSPLLALFSVLIAPIAALISFWLGRKLKKMQVKVQETEAAYRSFMQESMANLLIVKSFANEEYSIEKLAKLRDNRFYWVFKRTKFGLISSTSMSMSFQTAYVVAFAYGALQVASKAITYGTMSVFLTLVNRVQAPVMQLAQQIPKVVSILASAGRIMELQNLPEEKCLPEHIEAQNVGVELENVTFGYTDEKVFENTGVRINAGEFVAIIGESGIGKTTLIRLIMSFMSNIEGRICFTNEKGETELANAGTREFIAYVPQGNTLFSGTIRENLLMGNLNATEEEMIDALKLSSGYDFVMALPNGIDTVIGERGHGLSEGQAQRIAIARAFVRKAPFLILDEATSSLDEKTELNVIKGLQQLSPKPTCLIITHRKSILPYCDRQIIIENREIKEA